MSSDVMPPLRCHNKMATGLSKNIHFVFYVFLLLVPFGWGRDHRIQLKDEVRQTIELSKFGFLQNGILSVNISDMVVQGNHGSSKDVMLGFSLEKTGSDGISPYMEQHSEKCIFKDHSFDNANQISLALIKFDLRSGHEKIIINKFGKDFLNLTIDNTPALLESATSAVKSSSTKQNAVEAPTLPADAAITTTLSSSSNVGGSTSATSSSSPAAESSSTSASSSATPSTSILSSASNVGGSTSATSSSSPASESSSTSTLPSTKQGTSTAVSTTSTQAASTTVKVAKNGSTTANPEGNDPSKNSARRRRNAETNPVTLAESKEQSLPLYSKRNNISQFKYSGNFVVKVKSKAEEGLYNLYFHNCPLPNAQSAPPVPVSIQIRVIEKNGDNYLSAGEEPLPYMFGVLSVLFFGTAIYWLRVLRNNRQYTYKVHYMMFVLVLLKALDLMFQAVNFHFISRDGTPEESWEVLYYITHLLKGALLFTVIVLIGTGYFFIKHVLSDRDKKIFMIVIPLQILANTAQIVMESTEEANTQYTTWISFTIF
ncbi:hypothetical protein ACROYT_G003749 [Oculina patagonica]